MSRYIDADKAKEALYIYFGITSKRAALGIDILIDRIPTADVENVVHAHWKYIGMMHDASYIYECSKCGRRIFIDWSFLLKDYPSCHCGARMDEKVK